MRLIPTRVHAMLDLSVGALLLGLPWMMGTWEGAKSGPETWVAVALGVATITYGIVAAMRLAEGRHVAPSVHVAFSSAAGLLLIFSPWVLDFAHVVWVPYVLIGGLELTGALAARMPMPCGTALPATRSDPFATLR